MRKNRIEEAGRASEQERRWWNTLIGRLRAEPRRARASVERSAGPVPGGDPVRAAE